MSRGNPSYEFFAKTRCMAVFVCDAWRCFGAAGCPRRSQSAAGRHTVLGEYSVKLLKWGLLYTAAFLAAFVGSALLKLNSDPTHGKYKAHWDDTVGKVYTDGSQRAPCLPSCTMARTIRCSRLPPPNRWLPRWKKTG